MVEENFNLRQQFGIRVCQQRENRLRGLEGLYNDATGELENRHTNPEK
jgi:hypothetical protein